MFGTYVGNGMMLVATKWSGRLFVPADDLHLMPLLVAYGGHEPGLTNWIIKNIKPGMKVVDAGANIGYFTVALAMCVGEGGRVDAFEPFPRHMEILKNNLVTNYVTPQVIVHEVAVGDISEMAVLQWGTGEEMGASIQKLNCHKKHITSEINAAPVQVVRLDKIITDPVDFIKLDVEGNEYRALLGAQGIIGEKTVVAFEWNKDMLGEDFPKMMEMLRNYARQGAQFSYPKNDGELVPVELGDLTGVEFSSSIFMQR